MVVLGPLLQLLSPFSNSCHLHGYLPVGEQLGYGLDLQCLSRVSGVCKWGLGKVTGLQGATADLLEMGYCRCDVGGYIPRHPKLSCEC